MKLCINCAYCVFKGGSWEAFCEKMTVENKQDDPSDFVYGGKISWTVKTCQKTRENVDECSPDAKWFMPKNRGGLI